MKSKSAKAAGRRSRSKTSKQKNQLPKPPVLEDHPDLQDRFTRSTQRQERLHLIGEHREKMKALEQHHQGQLWSIRQQLQLALFKIWNEIWMQKKAAYAKAHKDWLKILAA